MLQDTDFGDAGFGSGAYLMSFGTGGPKKPTIPCDGDDLFALTEGDAQVVHATYSGHDLSATEEISQVASSPYATRFFDRAASAQQACGRTTHGTLVAGPVHRVAVDGGAAQWYVLTGQDGKAVADVGVVRLGARFGVLRVDGETINATAMGSLARAAANRLRD